MWQFVVALALALSGCGYDRPDFQDSPAAVIRVHQDEIPGFDRDTFFPVGLYHALTGRYFGRDYSLGTAAAAGFNTVQVWQLQALAPAVAEARRLGLRIIRQDPTDAEVAALAGDAVILGWDIDEEPSMVATPAATPARLARFRDRRARIHALDPGHPVFFINSAVAMKPSHRARWELWLHEGDVSAHFNYPFVDRLLPGDTLDTPRGIPASVAEAVAAAGGRRPVLFVVQTFGSPVYGWVMPRPDQLRAMTYAAVIHGAAGIVFFAKDSFVTRDGQVLGIAPDPAADYGPTPDFDGDKRPPLRVDAAALRRSRQIWGEASRLARQLTALAPDLLAPTARFPYAVAIRGHSASATPIRTLLKDRGGRLTLLVVNLDDDPVTLRLRPGRPLAAIGAVVGAAPRRSAVPGAWEADLEPYGVRVWRLRPAGAIP